MSLSRLSNRYAKSLVDLALEQDKLDQIKSNTDLVYNAICSNPDLDSMMRSPIINETKKKSVLHLIFEGKIDDLLMKFIDLLLVKNREKYLMYIIQVFRRRYNEHMNIKLVTIVTALGIDKNVREKLVSKLTNINNGAKIELSSEVNKDLIGGFILRFDDWQYDASIARNLQLMRKAFDSNVYVRKF